MNESALSIWKYNASGWTEVSGSSVETANNTVSARVASAGKMWQLDPSARTFGAFGPDSPAPPDQANFSVAVTETNSPVSENETLTVNATVENTGDENGSKEVVLTINGTEVDAAMIELAPGESASVPLTWATSEGDAGEYTAEAFTEDDGNATTVVVEAQTTVDDGQPGFGLGIAILAVFVVAYFKRRRV